MTTKSGVLVVDKPRGPTSHDLVSQARRIYRTRAVGHAGTLDPMATGVLVLLIGEATKLSPYLTAATKRYRAVVRLGIGTDTLDAEGRVIDETNVERGLVDRARIERALGAERLRREQIPPAYSAIKVRGVRAHRAARQGKTPDLAPRPVRVWALELRQATDTELELELEVDKGYYVRALARDLGQHLGLPAHLASLERLASGPFGLSEAVPLSAETAESLIPLPQAARRAMPAASLSADGAERARQGKRLVAGDFRRPPENGPSAWFSPSGALVAIGTHEEDGTFRVRRGFRQA